MIEGLDKLQRELAEAQKAFAEVDGELGSVSFDPESPASIEIAIITMEQLIDERLGTYSNNSLVGPMICEMKDKYRTAIIDRAAKARLGGQTDDGE
jgi:hypothetical protein